MYQQIPALFYSLRSKFKDSESVRITTSQLGQLEALIKDYCHYHDAPRLKSLVKRIHRRMDQHADHHLWLTEYEFIREHLMSAMKEVKFCRAEDNPESVIGVLNRSNQMTHREGKDKTRVDDHMLFSQSVKNILDKWMH